MSFIERINLHSLRSGVIHVHKFGYAPDYDIADGRVTVWDGAADNTNWENMVYDYSTSADIDSLSSNNTGDTEDIEIQGLDANYDLVTQTVTLNGQNRVALTTNLLRVFRMKNVGTNDLAGKVFCFVNGTLTGGVPDTNADIRAIINDANNQTLMALYTVPDGYNAYLTNFWASNAGAVNNNVVEIDLLVRPFGQVFQLKHRASLLSTGASHFQHDYEIAVRYGPKSDIEMRANTDTNTSAVAAGFDLILIPSNY